MEPEKLDTYQQGQVLLIDKPLEWTSFQVVNHVRWTLRKHLGVKKIKVGHAGTLDPLATGLLLVCTGRATKRIQDLQALPKTYEGTMTVGATRPSFDMETPVDAEFPIEHLSEEEIRRATAAFTGDIEQVPPVYSALKKDGKPLYEYARKGEEVTVPPRKVRIDEFTITGVALPEIHFRVLCSKGTYIRSLAHDFGKSLGSGAYLSALRRTKIGDYNVNKGLSPLDFRESLWKNESNS